ncbi:hypothetical protein BH09CHL1_BH09CHL1_14560 [soil metagenome]
MKIARSGRGLLASFAIAALAAPLAFSPVANAQESTPAGAPPAVSIPNGCTVVASGLYNPRYVAVDADGSVYVTEAGHSGDTPIFATPGAGTPVAADPVTTAGTSGQVTKIAADGTQSVLTTGLSSITFGTEVVGPAGIAISNGKIYVATGGPGPMTPAVAPIAGANSIISIDPATGEATVLSDIGAYEVSTNPDPNAIDSDLYGLSAGADGSLYVADAGGNVVYKVNAADGTFAPLAVIPGLAMEGFSNPLRGGAAEIDPVPTSVYAAADGTVYVGLLSGAPFAPGTAKVQAIAADGTVSDFVNGLTTVVDVTASPNGTLYASQLSTNFTGAAGPEPGQIVRLNADGTSTPVAGGLFLLNGIAFDTDGSFYAVIGTTAPADAPPSGQLLKCDLATTEADAAAAAGSTPAATVAAEAPATETATEAAAAAGATAVTVTSGDLFFDPKEISIPANTDVQLTFTNNGALAHDFVIDALGVKTALLNPGESVTITINAAAGDYQFYCSVPGHKEAGMVGTLKVQ